VQDNKGQWRKEWYSTGQGIVVQDAQGKSRTVQYCAGQCSTEQDSKGQCRILQDRKDRGRMKLQGTLQFLGTVLGCSYLNYQFSLNTSGRSLLLYCTIFKQWVSQDGSN
jgi:hypothetical protein